MFASISKFYSAVKTAVATQYSKRWVKVVGAVGVVTVAVGGAAMIFPMAAAGIASGVVSGFKAIGSFFSGLFTKSTDGGAAAPVGDAVAA